MTQLVTPQCMIENKNTFFIYWDLPIGWNDKLDHVVQQEENTYVDLKPLPNEEAPGTVFQLKQKRAFPHCSWTRSTKYSLEVQKMVFHKPSSCLHQPRRRVTWFQMFSPSLLWSHQSYQLKERPPSHIETVSINTTKNPDTQTAAGWCRLV